MIPTSCMIQTADTLKYLYMGGRIGRAQHLVGSLLSIKPLIGMEEGVIVPLGQARSRKQAYAKIVEMVEAAVAPSGRFKNRLRPRRCPQGGGGAQGTGRGASGAGRVPGIRAIARPRRAFWAGYRWGVLLPVGGLVLCGGNGALVTGWDAKYSGSWAASTRTGEGSIPRGTRDRCPTALVALSRRLDLEGFVGFPPGIAQPRGQPFRAGVGGQPVRLQPVLQAV